jgi:hypothetical protein
MINYIFKGKMPLMDFENSETSIIGKNTEVYIKKINEQFYL